MLIVSSNTFNFNMCQWQLVRESKAQVDDELPSSLRLVRKFELQTRTENEMPENEVLCSDQPICFDDIITSCHLNSLKYEPQVKSQISINILDGDKKKLVQIAP